MHRALQRDLVVRRCRGRPARPCGRRRPPRRGCPARIAASPWRNALPAAQPPADAARAPARIARARLNLRSSSICNVMPSRQPNRLAAAAVDVRHLDRFGADLQNAIAALDDIPFRARRTACSGRRSAPRSSCPSSAPRDPDELQRDRRQRRRRRRTGRHRRRPAARSRGGGGGGGGGAFGLNRNRLRSAAARLRPLRVQRLEVHVRRRRAAVGAACPLRRGRARRGACSR